MPAAPLLLEELDGELPSVEISGVGWYVSGNRTMHQEAWAPVGSRFVVDERDEGCPGIGFLVDFIDRSTLSPNV